MPRDDDVRAVEPPQTPPPLTLTPLPLTLTPPTDGEASVITELVICGGGMSGIAMLGALHHMHERGRLSRVTRYVGSSIGAVISLCLCIGYSPSTLFKITRGLDFGIFNQIDCDSLVAFFDTYGTMDASVLRSLVAAVMRASGTDPHITLDALRRATRCDLVVTGFNVDRGKTVYFSAESQPSMRVMDAIEITTCIPYIYRPIHYRGEMYVDGGLVRPIPLRAVRRPAECFILGVHVDITPPTYRIHCTTPPTLSDGDQSVGAVDRENRDSGDILGYTLRLFHHIFASARRHDRRRLKSKYRRRHLFIRLRGVSAIMDFSMDEQGKDDLFARGLAQAQRQS